MKRKINSYQENPVWFIPLLAIGGGVLLGRFVFGKDSFFGSITSPVEGLAKGLKGVGDAMPYAMGGTGAWLVSKYAIPPEMKGLKTAGTIGSLLIYGYGVYKVISSGAEAKPNISEEEKTVPKTVSELNLIRNNFKSKPPVVVKQAMGTRMLGTVIWFDIDVQFENTTDKPILIFANPVANNESYSGDYIKIPPKEKMVKRFQFQEAQLASLETPNTFIQIWENENKNYKVGYSLIGKVVKTQAGYALDTNIDNSLVVE